MPDYMFLLESRLSPEQRAVLLRVQELAAALGFNVYLTGGTVRDLITGAPLRDLDFTVEGNPSKLAREMEKGGAKIRYEDERFRHVELIFAGDCDGSIAAARDDFYVRPGTRPEIRWSTIMEDLRRRDFSLNAIALSLNSASRGLLLDPTNGLSDVERCEVRALTIHSFTNQPVRLLRALRYAARMGYKLEQRTQEWFELAMERDLHHTIAPNDAGEELHHVAREDRPSAVLKLWESHGVLEALHPLLAKRHPDHEAISRLNKVRDDLLGAGLRPRLGDAMLAAILGRLKSREQSAVLGKLGFRSAEADAVLGLEDAALRTQKELTGRRANVPIDAYRLLQKTPLEHLAYILAESSNSKALSKIRAYLQKWRPTRSVLQGVAAELETLGLARGPKFDAVIEQMFALQLTGKGKAPEDRLKILRKLSGIKEPPKKKLKEEKKQSTHMADKLKSAGVAKHAAATALARGAKAKPKAALHAASSKAKPHSKTGPKPAKKGARGNKRRAKR
jgi:tRNA nucleotidyltransferase (CCA-adding enzyme)